MTDSNRYPMHADFDTTKFGVELEMHRITRPAAAAAVASVLWDGAVPAGAIRAGHDFYLSVYVRDPQGREWRFMTDSSIGGPRDYQCEMVTPPLTMADMDKLQEAVRALRRAGARCHEGCGLHVHVDGARFGARELRNLVMIWNRWEDHLYAAADAYSQRGTYIRKLGETRPEFIAAMRDLDRDADLDAVNARWYGRTATYNPRASGDHYNATRYVGLNLHARWWIGTVEFRLWNATNSGDRPHAGWVRTAVSTSLALALMAIHARRVTTTKVELTPESVGNFSNFMIKGLRLTGERFNNVRRHLLRAFQAGGYNMNGWARLPAGEGGRTR